MIRNPFLMGVLVVAACFAQPAPIFPTFYPAGAHVNLYFPHLADGGPSFAQWQTSLEMINPSPSLTAHVSLQFYGDQGFPLNMDFGSGAAAQQSFTIPPNGRVTLRSSTPVTDKTVTGQAIGTSDIPVHGTILFRSTSNGSLSVELSAPATLPTTRYTSLATRDLGVAVANPTNSAKSYQITALDSSGNSIASTTIGIAAFGHKSFNLSDAAALPGLPVGFSGSIVITPQIPGDPFVAWTLNVERGLISTLPSGPQEWPISHSDRIKLVYNRLLAAAPFLLQGLGNNLSLQNPPNLVIGTDIAAATASASSNQNVQINTTLSELVSDSPSELAFLVAHELAHIAQYRSGAITVLLPNDPSNKEPDADLVAMILVLSAGFDPYGAAGAIGKLSMANGSPGLVDPHFDSLSDPSPTFSAARMNSMLGVISSACGYITMNGYCAPYKSTIHPHFPGSAPL